MKMCYKKNVTRSGITPLSKTLMIASTTAAEWLETDLIFNSAKTGSGGFGGIKIRGRAKSGKR
jgi:hypothetical protein